MSLIETIIHQRLIFIKKNGYAPNVLVADSDCKEFNGFILLGMKIRSSPFLSKNQLIMLREKQNDL